ncbi:MAG TPA: DUF6438 domain-containing protein [Ohtaekwangia sp.]|nr:DUF6438 domain-containing protein [Ohtaekwangia sp.]
MNDSIVDTKTDYYKIIKSKTREREVRFIGTTTKVGFYEGQIPKETFLQIEYEFRKANLQQLKGEYAVGWTDDETISTTFCRQNKFVNSIEDYGEAGPDELVWGYYPLRYLFQTLELKRIDSTKLPFYLNLHYFRFERKNEVCVLTQSESFLLWNYLRKGSIVQNSFDKKFNLSFVRNYIWAPSSDEMDDSYGEKSENKVRSIVSDGRHYAFDIEGQGQRTIDIGFNFFEINLPFLQFREKNEYD